MNAVFVTGTDTGVGKTVVTGLLARSLLDSGYTVITQKWIETGVRGFPPDIDTHLGFMRKKRSDIKRYLMEVSPYIFKRACAPHLAAISEGKRIKTAKIEKSFEYLRSRFDFVIVEGVGGALVPLDKKTLLIDIAGRLGIPAIIVARNRLGAINHTLLTVEALKRRCIEISGIIFNNMDRNEDRAVLDDNIRTVKRFTRVKVLAVVPLLQTWGGR